MTSPLSPRWWPRSGPSWASIWRSFSLKLWPQLFEDLTPTCRHLPLHEWNWVKRYLYGGEGMEGKRWGQGRQVAQGGLPLPSRAFFSLQPLRILGVTVHTGQSRRQILLDLNVRCCPLPLLPDPLPGHSDLSAPLTPLQPRTHPLSSFSPTPSYVGDVQIDVEVKKYFCKAGVKGMQVRQMPGASTGSLCLECQWTAEVGGWENQGWGGLGGKEDLL